MSPLTQELLNCDPRVRYAAAYLDGNLETATKSGTDGASSGESDRYEELLVNPAVLKLVTQRGNIDCGGARFVLIRYGNFYQWVQPVLGGHISVCIDKASDAVQVGSSLEQILRRHNLI